MSEHRPLQFRKVDGAPTKQESGVLTRPEPATVAQPAWMRAAPAKIRPAFTAPSDDDDEPGPFPHEQTEAQEQPPALHIPPPPPAPEPEPKLVPDPNASPMRRSSFPARGKSVFPPAVVISRLPPPPVVEEPKISEEQQAFAQAALELGALRSRILSTVESQLLQLSVQIAQTIIEREVAADPSLYRTLARTAVLALGDTQSARVRVSRSAYRAISELYGEAAIDVDGVRVEVTMDASYEALSVVAEAGPSRVDSRLSERLSAMLRAMEAEHRRNNATIDAEEAQ